MATQLPLQKRKIPPPIFGSCLLWPNGWMDQVATWYGGRPWPRQQCVRWGLSSHAKGTATSPPQFSAHVWSVVAKRLIRLRCHLVLRLVTLCYMGIQLPFPKRGGGTATPKFLAHVYCGQLARCIKMPLGTEVGLGPGHIVSDGDPAPKWVTAHSPPRVFGTFVVAIRLDG